MGSGNGYALSRAARVQTNRAFVNGHLQNVAAVRHGLFIWLLGPDLRLFRPMNAITAPYLETPQSPECDYLGQITSQVLPQHGGWLQIPIHRGHLLRFDRGQATDLMAATIPI